MHSKNWLRSLLLTTALSIILSTLTLTLAFANAFIIEVVKPTNSGIVRIFITPKGGKVGPDSKEVVTSISESFTVAQKRNFIFNQLQNAGFKVEQIDNTKIKITDLPEGTGVCYDPGTTGEGKDRVTKIDPPREALIHFENTLFDPIGRDGLPAMFTAGITTDAGELSATVSSLELTQTDGASIVQALFTKLEPQATVFGATLVNGGNFLDITFDPAKSLGEAGVVFGTTSPSEGVRGSVLPEAVPEPSFVILLGAGTISLCGFASRLRNRVA